MAVGLGKRPVSGEEIPEGWFGRLWDYLSQLRPVKGDGKTIIVRDGIISAINPEPSASGNSEGTIYCAVIKSSVDTWNYTADIYTTPDEDAVKTDVTVKINQNQLADGEVIPSGTCLEVRKQYHGTGDNKQQYWTVIGLSRSY